MRVVVASVRVRVKRSYMETPETNAAIVRKAVMPPPGDSLGGGMVGNDVVALGDSTGYRRRRTASSVLRRPFQSAPETSAFRPACSIL